MPKNRPGTLGSEQYQQVLAFLLLENRYVDAGSIWLADQLSTIPLSR